MNDDWPDDVPASERQAQVEAAKLVPGMVWLGDLSGMEVVATPNNDDTASLHIAHRCGTWWELPPMPGMTGTDDDSSVMMGNLLEFAVKAIGGHACPPRNPSPEHRARVARWAAAAGHQPARAGHLEGASEGQTRDVLGDDATNQLDVVRALSRRPTYPPADVGLPLTVSPPFGLPLEDLQAPPTPTIPLAPIGVLRTVYDEMHKAAGTTGHGPEDYPEEPADIPVRRCIDGKWQTVEVTMSDFRANEGADGRQPHRVKPDPEGDA